MTGVLALLLLALVLPSADFAVFDGLPLDRWPELLGLIVLAPLLVSPRMRRWSRRWWRRCPPRHRQALIASLAGIVGLKALMLAAGVYWGFPACYLAPDVRTVGQRQEVSWPVGPRACEASYANLLHRFGVTRIDHVLAFGTLGWEPIDRALNFGESDWNLSFVNARRFNIRPWIGGNVWRVRLPFEVDWRGEVEFAAPTVVRVSYTGEASVRVGDQALRLAPQYRRVEEATAPVPAGRHALEIHYRFDDGSRVGLRSPGPYATFRFTADGRPVAAAPPGRGWRSVAGVGDVLLAAWVLALGGLVVRLLWPLRWLLGPIVLLVVSRYLWEPRVALLPGALGLVLVAGVLLIRPGSGSRTRRIVAAWVAFLAASLARAATHGPSLGGVVYDTS